MSNKAKGFKDTREPEQIALDRFLKSTDKTKREVSDALHYYIDSDNTKQSYYQRICKLATGEAYTLTDKERRAIRHLLHVESNPHTYGKAFYKLDGLERKISQIERFLNSGYINKSEAAKRIKELKTLIPLSNPRLPE